VAVKKEENNLLKILIEKPLEKPVETENEEGKGKAAEEESKLETKTTKPRKRKFKEAKEEVKEEKAEEEPEIKTERLSVEDLRKELGAKPSGISRSFYIDSPIWMKLIELSESLGGVSTSRIVNQALKKFFDELESKEGRGDRKER